MRNEKQATDPITPRYVMSGFHNKMGRFLGAAAIDARAAPVRAVKNMAAGAIRTLIQYPPNN